jgi:thiamine biosynthesis lipoprotein ApbE
VPRTWLFLITAAAIASAAVQAPVRRFHHENVLGTSFAFSCTCSAAEAAKAESAALQEIDRLAKILSAYDSTSDFSRWFQTRGAAVPVARELAEVLSLYDHWQLQTSGAINAAASTRLTPEAMRGPHWRIEGNRVTHLSAVPLTLNSFTKGYILDRAANAARQFAPGVVLNIGGDIVVAGAHRETIHIANPLDDTENSDPIASVETANRAVATSGSSRRGRHIIDPRSATAVSHIASATVAARNAVTAGALATAFNVLTVAESQRVAARYPDVDYLIVDSGGRRFTSPGWRQMAFLAAAQAPAESEVIVNVELARIDAGRYRRPFVAVWVEDKDKFPLRTLALWFDKDRWLPDLRSWYRGDRIRSMAEGSSITGSVSSATRSPGKYVLKWDGKDNAGKPVKPGKYTILLEAAREHGTYQVMRQEIEFPGTPKQIPLTGGTEIASASIEIRKPGAR